LYFVGAGTCEGGKIGRLVNSLRGFVNIGMHVTETGTGPDFQQAFKERVLDRNELSLDDKIIEANAVLDYFGIEGRMREEWIRALE
jgi:hypothetical protein